MFSNDETEVISTYLNAIFFIAYIVLFMTMTIAFGAQTFLFRVNRGEFTMCHDMVEAQT